MPEQQKQVIYIVELPVLRTEILDRAWTLLSSGINETRKKGIFKVALTLSDFYDAWLESTSTMNSAGSDTTSRVHGLPHMAKIWLVINDTRLLDSFCASRITDESLPLDILTLKRFIPNDKRMHPSLFFSRQSQFNPRPQGLAFRGILSGGSAPLDKRFLGPPETPSRISSRATLSGVSSPSTTTPTGGSVEETALDQPIPTKKAFAPASSYTGDSTVEGTSWDQPASRKKGFASTSSHPGDPRGDETPNLRQRR